MTGWMKTLALAAGIAMLATTALTGSASADTIDDIKKRGKLIVGVKADYAPYGFLASSGKILGLEPHLAQDVADVLGVELEPVPVVSSNRMQFLDHGKLHLMIATLTATAERRAVVAINHPHHYSLCTHHPTNANTHNQEKT